MSRFKQCLALLSVAIFLGSAWIATAAQDAKPDAAARKAFIENFNRTGLNTTLGDAMMLRVLVASSGAKKGVEVGSASGFGAINMGIAFERNGGTLETLEIDPGMVKQCRAAIAAMGLENTVTCLEGDALKTLPELKGQYDFMFIDALKSDYLKYFQIMEPKLKAGAVIIADNCIKSERAMKDYLDYVHNSPNYETVVIRASMEKGDGMAISYKIR